MQTNESGLAASVEPCAVGLGGSAGGGGGGVFAARRQKKAGGLVFV